MESGEIMKRTTSFLIIFILIFSFYSCFWRKTYEIPDGSYWISEDGKLTFAVTKKSWRGTFETEDGVVRGYWGRSINSDKYTLSSIPIGENKSHIALIVVILTKLKEDYMIFEVVYPDDIRDEKIKMIKQPEDANEIYPPPQYPDDDFEIP